MKLCDLDEMLKTINPFKSLHDQYMYNSIKTLGKMCEIKAIPVEWLKEKAKEYAWKYWDAKEGNQKLMLPMKDITIVIEQMVEEWEREK